MVGNFVGCEDCHPLAVGAQVLADDEGAVDAVEQQGEFGGPRAGRGEHRDLGVGAADIHRAAQIAAVGDDDLGVVPGHTGPCEGGRDGGDGRYHFHFQAVLGCPEGAHDAEEAGVAVGEHDGGTAVLGDAAGGQGHAAEPDPLGVPRDFGQCEVVGGAGHEGGGAEGGAGGGGQRGAVPSDHRDPVGHARQSPGAAVGTRAGSAGGPAAGRPSAGGSAAVVRWSARVAQVRGRPRVPREVRTGAGAWVSSTRGRQIRSRPPAGRGPRRGPRAADSTRSDRCGCPSSRRPRCGCGLSRRCAARPR